MSELVSSIGYSTVIIDLHALLAHPHSRSIQHAITTATSAATTAASTSSPHHCDTRRDDNRGGMGVGVRLVYGRYKGVTTDRLRSGDGNEYSGKKREKQVPVE